MFCPNCECPFCMEQREEQNKQERIQYYLNMWNWNASPAEVAMELRDLVDSEPFDTDEMIEAIEKFFDADTAERVRDVIEVVT